MAPIPKPMSERFDEKISPCPNTGCWWFDGNPDTNGYGRFRIGGKGSKLDMAHRVSYELHKGKIPDGKLVLHTCDNRLCVNPDHLYAGTYQDNAIDAVSRGRMKGLFQDGYDPRRGF